MSINKIEMQDSNGNVLYPHTTGDLINYDTTKTVVQKIDELQNKLSTLKASLTTAVNNKTGSSLTSDSTIQEITNEVNSIVTLSSGTADANATAANILAGSTAYVNGNKVNGTMANQGAKTSSLNCGSSYTIPAGYHNGSGKVTANSLASQTQANADAGGIILDQTAYVNGNKITGTMPRLSENSNITYTNDNAAKVIVGDQAFGPINNSDGNNRVLIRYNGTNGYITGNTLVGVSTSNMASTLGVTANKIVAGNNICGVNGTADSSLLSSGSFTIGNYEQKIQLYSNKIYLILSECTDLGEKYITIINMFSTTNDMAGLYYRNTSNFTNSIFDATDRSDVIFKLCHGKLKFVKNSDNSIYLFRADTAIYDGKILTYKLYDITNYMI